MGIYIPHTEILFEGQHPVPGQGHDLLCHPEAPPPPRPLRHPQEAWAVVTPQAADDFEAFGFHALEILGHHPALFDVHEISPVADGGGGQMEGDLELQI